MTTVIIHALRAAAWMPPHAGLAAPPGGVLHPSGSGKPLPEKQSRAARPRETARLCSQSRVVHLRDRPPALPGKMPTASHARHGQAQRRCIGGALAAPSVLFARRAQPRPPFTQGGVVVLRLTQPSPTA